MNKILRKPTFVSAALICAMMVGCSSEEQDGQDETAIVVPTYYGEAKAILDTRCATCHQPNDIGSFPLTTYEEVKAFEGAVRASILNGSMPPWQPGDDCNTYVDNIDLRPDEKEVLLAWLDGGAPEGEPTDASASSSSLETAPFVADIAVALPEAYTPSPEKPDDHRCQLIPWPAEETRYVTGLRVVPDERPIVHHTIVFVIGPDQVAEYQAFDEAEEGPGYECFGGPRPAGGGGQGLGGAPSIPAQVGFWVPGAPATPFPEGTGIRIEPGSMLVVQMHYNTRTAAPVADQSLIEITTTDSVEREGFMVQVLDIGWVTNGQFGGDPMTIPAGEANVGHDTSVAFDSLFLRRARAHLGLADDAPLVMHSAGHHMHELGSTQRTELQHADGSSTCMLHTPDWDFNWQGRYYFKNPITFRAGDTLWMGCTWDNSASNQPIIDGVAKEPVDVAWGEGTSDEMCLGGFYATAE